MSERVRAAVWIGLMALGAGFSQPGAPSRPLAEQAYAGLALRDTPIGTLVDRPTFGPFHGDIRRSDSVWRGDVITSVVCAGRTLRAGDEGPQKLSAAAFRELIQSASPGDELTIVYRRARDAEQHLDDPEPTGDADGEKRTATVRLGSRDEWTGSVGRGLRPRANLPPLPEGEFEPAIASTLDRLAISDVPDGGDALVRYLSAVQEAALDPNSLPAVVRAYRRPLSGPTVEREMASDIRSMLAAPDLRRAVLDEIGKVLDISGPRSGDRAVADAACLAHRPIAERFLRLLRDWPFISDQDAIRLTRESGPVFDEMMARAAQLPQVADRFEQWGRRGPERPQPIPEELRGAVTGEIVRAEHTDLGWAVRGGPGVNAYDMSRLAVVVDPGGDDRYRWPAAHAFETQVIIDLAGNDRYESNTDFAGPGAASFGASLVDDASGNDVYATTSMGSLASGLFGVGVVIDRAGDDRYENGTPGAGWAEGAGAYGAGILVDLDGSDSYRGEVLCQGVGGPRGFGSIIDVRGNDSYASTGPDFASTSDFKDSWHSMSQGMGYGARGHASGGVGAIYDLGGDDTYDAGEYAQGCGYFFGLGILHDAAGADRYTGAAFVQAYAAHQGLGMLIDDGGNDAYSARLMTGQSTAWDQSMAWLIDRAGDDVYASIDEGQASATYQSLSVLIDLGGSDTYGSGHGLQAQPGINAARSPAESLIYGLALFLDRGGASDQYSSPGRANGESTLTGTRDDAVPENTRLYGVFDDQ